MITFTRDWRGYAKGSSIGTLAATLEAVAVAEGAATYGGIAGPLNSGLDRYGNVSSLVDGGGNIAARLDNTPGADKSRIPTQSMESVAAMSTTVTVRMAPTGTYRTARVSWVNNGASGSAKLNIAANCENDVAGIVATQSALQRDAQMTMGDALLLISPVPITSLNFSSDGSITSDTHRLVVTFGA